MILRPTIAAVIGLNRDGPAPCPWSRSESLLEAPCSCRLADCCSLRLGVGSRPQLLLSQFVTGVWGAYGGGGKALSAEDGAEVLVVTSAAPPTLAPLENPPLNSAIIPGCSLSESGATLPRQLQHDGGTHVWLPVKRV